MSKVRNIVDPTLPYTPLTLGGADYKLCLDFEAIAMAEEELSRKGIEANLLMASWRGNASDILALFAASLHIYHPEISYAEAKKLVTWQNSAEVALALRKARGLFLPEAEKGAKKKDPTEAHAG